MGEIIVINTILSIAWIVVFIITHEFGHYVKARQQGIYKGWDILPTPHVKLSRKFARRSDYAYGMVYSCLSFPLFFFTNIPAIFFPMVVVLTGAGDILIMCVWGRA